MKKLIFVFVGLCFVMGWIVWQSPQPLRETLAGLQPLTRTNPSNRLSQDDDAKNTPVGIPKHGTATAIDPEFRQWIASEAKQLDLPQIDGAKRESELRQLVKSLNDRQREQLMQTVTDSSAAAGEKILSVYLLVQAAAAEELAKIVAAPMKEQGPQPVHSDAEALAMRERTIKAMALDGLIEQAKSNPAAAEKLTALIAEISDPLLKARAQKELDQIQRTKQ